MTTKFVYFDVGGVVVLDFSGTNKWEQLKKELGIDAAKNADFEAFWNEYEPKVNAGLDVETLLPLIKKKFDSSLPEGYSFLFDGFVNRFEVNRSIWPVIDKIHKQCKVGLLTNMYPHMFEAIKKRGLLPEVSWNTVIDSSVEGVTKPNPQIFRLGEQKAGFKGTEILFVDNSRTHTEAAGAFGWQVFLYDSSHPDKSSKELSRVFG